MRIVGGALKGRRLAAPTDARIRPTSDRAREALFNLLAHADFGDFTLEGARVLDLFAGTGALGFEALSRGAAFCLFIDDHAPARTLIQQNAEALGLLDQSQTMRRDAARLGAKPAGVEPSILLFADPPYGTGLGVRALEGARGGGWLAPHALAVLEDAADADIPTPEGFELLDRRRYGAAQLFIYRLVDSV